MTLGFKEDLNRLFSSRETELFALRDKENHPARRFISSHGIIFFVLRNGFFFISVNYYTLSIKN